MRIICSNSDKEGLERPLETVFVPQPFAHIHGLLKTSIDSVHNTQLAVVDRPAD